MRVIYGIVHWLIGYGDMGRLFINHNRITPLSIFHQYILSYVYNMCPIVGVSTGILPSIASASAISFHASHAVTDRIINLERKKKHNMRTDKYSGGCRRHRLICLCCCGAAIVDHCVISCTRNYVSHSRLDRVNVDTQTQKKTTLTWHNSEFKWYCGIV